MRHALSSDSARAETDCQDYQKNRFHGLIVAMFQWTSTNPFQARGPGAGRGAVTMSVAEAGQTP